MAGLGARRAVRLNPYSGTAVASLRLAAALSLAFWTGGCAVSGSIGGFSKQQKADEARAAYANDDDVTHSTGAKPAPAAAAAASTLPSETDLVFARMAVVEMLKRGGKQVSAPWENPSSGARGTVTPIASAYPKDGMICHDFLASYVRQKGGETWMQGEACRPKQGGKAATWEVKSLRPWSRS